MDKSLTEVLANYIDLRYINDDSIIVDAGACFGAFIEALREHPEASKSRVIALECDRANAEILRNKELPNVEIYEKALVGQKSPKNVLFYKYVGLPQWGSTIERKVRHKKLIKVVEYKVKALRINDILDDLGIQYIDLLKMDIEGGEMAVMETMTQKTALRIKQLSIEVHLHPRQKTRPVFKKILERLGYKARIEGVDMVHGILKGVKRL